ncbi:hypothetical protein HOY82DRAFT_638202 [Tuber indicum]|nr:hypothetical protein HOY82DRAFT_638202 [Tuber indicum]
MSSVSIEHSLVETLDSLMEQGDYLCPDNEFFIPLLDQGPVCAAAPNMGINFASPSGVFAAEGEASPGYFESPEPCRVELIEKNVVAMGEKKKRKSWVQELPIPRTTLPPRKRAKTDEEKEQRRIERILRNRAAARSSRQRKEKQVEALEEERKGLAESNASMRDRLAAVEQSNRSLRQQLSAMEQILTSYEDQMKVITSDVTMNSMVQPADPDSSSSLWGPPDPRVCDEENLFWFHEMVEQPPATTIDPSVLGGAIGPRWGEPVIGTGYFNGAERSSSGPISLQHDPPGSEDRRGHQAYYATSDVWAQLGACISSMPVLFLLQSAVLFDYHS